MENLKSPLIVGTGTGQIALGLKESAEIVQAASGIGMLGPQHLLPDRQGPLIVGTGTGQIALGLKESAEIVQASILKFFCLDRFRKA
jgi:hypothetical protein